jgi:hypothetical protein
MDTKYANVNFLTWLWSIFLKTLLFVLEVILLGVVIFVVVLVGVVVLLPLGEVGDEVGDIAALEVPREFLLLSF